MNPYGRFELDMNSRIDPATAATAKVPGPRTAPDTQAPASAADGGAGSAS
jgi:hypothetical protein